MLRATATLPANPVTMSARGIQETVQMMKALTTFAALAIAMIAAGTQSHAAAKPDRVKTALAKFERTGKVARCLSTHRIVNINAIDDRHLLIKVSPRVSYLSVLPFRCSGLRFHNAIAYRSFAGRVCRSDTFKVIETGFYSGTSCGFGRFEKLRRTPKRRN